MRERMSARRTPRKPPNQAQREVMQFIAYEQTYNTCETFRDIMSFAKPDSREQLVRKSHTGLSEYVIRTANANQHSPVVALYYHTFRPLWKDLVASGALPHTLDDPLLLDIHELFIAHAAAVVCVNAFEQVIYENFPPLQ